MLGKGWEVATVAHSASKGSRKDPEADDERIVVAPTAAAAATTGLTVVVVAATAELFELPLPLNVAQLLG